MTEGVLYYLLGTRHWNVAVTSLLSLREVYDGPVSVLLVDDLALEMFDRIKKDGRLDPIDGIDFRSKQQVYGRHTGYMNKPKIVFASPYDSTVYLDADTIVAKPIDSLFGKQYGGRPWLTMFAGWQTNGGRMKRRLLRWKEVMPDEVEYQTTHPLPAINTGVVSFTKGERAELFGADWMATTESNPGFIADEMAAQLLIRDHGVILVDDRWNCSPIYGKFKDDVVVWHLHGRKHLREVALPIWWPWYQRAVEMNLAGIAEWTPSGVDRLARKLEEDKAE